MKSMPEQVQDHERQHEHTSDHNAEPRRAGERLRTCRCVSAALTVASHSPWLVDRQHGRDDEHQDRERSFDDELAGEAADGYACRRTPRGPGDRRELM